MCQSTLTGSVLASSDHNSGHSKETVAVAAHTYDITGHDLAKAPTIYSL